MLAYGVSITTLEDVFMKVGMLEDDLDVAEEKDKVAELFRPHADANSAIDSDQENSNVDLLPQISARR